MSDPHSTSVKQQGTLRDLELIRSSKLFDLDFYCAQTGRKLDLNSAIEHYLEQGAKSGLNPHPLFDGPFYVTKYADIAKAGINPFIHYLTNGVPENRWPNPNFNNRYYIDENPDVAQSGLSPLLHYALIGKKEQRQTVAQPITSADIAQDIYVQMRKSDARLPRSAALPAMRQESVKTFSRAGAAYQTIARELTEPFSHLLIIPWLKRSGADRVVANFVKVIQEKLGSRSVLIVLTRPEPTEGVHFFAADTRFLRLHDCAENLTAKDKEAILLRLILQLKPPVVHIINSDIGCSLINNHAKEIKSVSRLFATLFCFDTDPDGVKAGYPALLQDSLTELDCLFVDNNALLEEMRHDFGYSSTELQNAVIVYHPFEVRPRDIKISGGTKTVLWASRLDQQKRPDILAKVAQQMPDIHFDIWGEPIKGVDLSVFDKLPNVTMKGAYEGANSLPYENYSCYLYTSEWDGMPNAVIAAMAAGLPVVAPKVGGVPELINKDTGWLIDQFDDVPAFTKAIRECLKETDERLRRSKLALSLVRERHSWKHFSETIERTGYLS